MRAFFMKRLLIKQLNEMIGQNAKISGFVHAIRDQGNIKFLIIRDISGTCQVVITNDSGDVFGKVSTLTLESVVEIVGSVVKEPQSPNGFEMRVEEITLLSRAAALPIPVVEKSAKETSQEKRLDWRWIDLRKTKNALIFKVWTTFESAFQEFLVGNGFIEIHSPKFMSTPSESGAELFSVPYFDKTAYLAQSPQFYKQMAMASGFERVFEIGPIFRANPSFTSRHDTEFTGFDFEFSYIESHHDVMDFEAQTLVHMLSAVKEKHAADIQEHFGVSVNIPSLPFPKISMKEAKSILANAHVPSEKEGDLSPEEERALSAYVKKEYGHEFVFVTDYPIDVRPFYHMRHEQDQTLTKSFDLLWKGIEVTTGAQREHRYDILLKQAESKGLSLSGLKYYLNFFKYGCPPHGGVGMGPSRMIMKLLEQSNVREVTYLYLGIKRLDP